jgi:tetratricopeptide (TPR) repeat protein
VRTTLSNFALLYVYLGRYADAEPLYLRTLAIKEKALGEDHVDIATTLNNIAQLYVYQGRYAEAEPFYGRAIAIKEKALGPEHHELGTALNNLANLYEKHGRFADAEPLYRRTLAIKEKALGADHTEVGSVLHNLGALYVRQDRYADAEPLYLRALEVKQRALGPDHPDVSTSLDGLAQLHFAREDWETAAAFAQRSVDVILRRSRRGIESLGQALTGRVESEAARARYTFLSLVKASHRLAQAAPARARGLERGMFEVAQWAQASDAANALSQMAARQAKGDTELARLVRERQDLVAEWQSRDKALIAAVTRPAGDCDPQSRNQCAGRHARGRSTHDRNPPRHT